MDLRYRHSVSVAAVVTDELGRVLVMKRVDNGGWQLPGGVLGQDEALGQGLIREVREQTGVQVRPGRLTGVYKDMKLGVVALVFRADMVGGEAHRTARSEDVAWWAREQVADLMTPAFALRILDALLESNAPSVRHHDGMKLLDPIH
jgi:8-oxo-dGTP diphosphatase